MENSQSNLTIQTANNKTTFNFQLENGLPFKNIIETESDIGYSNEENFFALSIYFLNKEDRLKCNDFMIQSYSIINDQLWLVVNDNYIPSIIYVNDALEALKNKKMIFYFFDENKKFLRGLSTND